jgi:hypothetical protein
MSTRLYDGIFLKIIFFMVKDLLGYIKREILDYMSDYQHLKKRSASWSSLANL